jgi:Fur family ferric uptake transcriptional regulator
MTASPDVPPRALGSLAEAIASLRDAGLRVSTPRRLVLEALFAAEGPVSAAHLAHALSLDESSVYRNLELLEQRGVVRHIHLGHSPGLYVLSAPEEVEYLYCERCERVTALPPGRLDGLRERIRAELGHHVRFKHFALVGTCAACAEVPAPGPQAPGPPDPAPASEREHLHSHGAYVHAHPHPRGAHRH